MRVSWKFELMSFQAPLHADAEPHFACAPEWGSWWSDPALRSRMLDGIEKCIILGLFSSFLVALLSSMIQSLSAGKSVVIGDAMLLITETMMVVLVLCRRSAKDLSLRPADWAVALTATSLSLLARPCAHDPRWWDAMAVVLTIAGLSMQLYAKMTLGRRFGLVAANRGICSSGPYRIVRHPIYFGYVMLHAGFFLLNPSMWNFAVFASLYTLKIPRILAEERLLGQDPEYLNYMNRVRYRLLPGVF